MWGGMRDGRVGESARCRDAGRADDGAGRHVAVLHGRQLVGNEQTTLWRERVSRAFADAARARPVVGDGRLPARVRGRGVGQPSPIPVVARRDEPLARADDDVLVRLLAQRPHPLGPRLVPRLGRALPGAVAVRHALAGTVTLQHEAGAVADLRAGGLRPEAPDERDQQVAAGREIRREVEGLEAPEVEIAARRAAADAPAVGEEHEPLVAADVHDEAGSARSRARAASGNGRRPDPVRAPRGRRATTRPNDGRGRRRDRQARRGASCRRGQLGGCHRSRRRERRREARGRRPGAVSRSGFEHGVAWRHRGNGVSLRTRPGASGVRRSSRRPASDRGSGPGTLAFGDPMRTDESAAAKSPSS